MAAVRVRVVSVPFDLGAIGVLRDQFGMSGPVDQIGSGERVDSVTAVLYYIVASAAMAST